MYEMWGFTLACIGFVVNLIGIPGIIATIVSVVGLINCYNKKLRGTVFAVLGIIIGLISIYFGIQIFLSGASTFLNEFFGLTP